MRVRHLQTYLNEQHLLKKSPTENLRDVTLGIDALYFLRNLNGIKDVLCNSSGCISPHFYKYLDEQCAKFESYNISIIFVFEGITAKAHKLFSYQFQNNVDQGWYHYVNGDKRKTLKNFSQVANACDSDLVYSSFHYLKSKGVKCIYSPYLATAQLAYFYEEGLIDMVFGPPTVLLFGMGNVIVNFLWKKNIIEWISLPHILTTWNINKEQFLDACLMAGTEYCLTFPYLSLSQFNGGATQFSFGTSLEFIKQAPLISYLQHFPNEQLRNNYIEGYCICKSLIKFPVVMLISGYVGFHSRSKNSLNNFSSLANEPLNRNMGEQNIGEGGNEDYEIAEEYDDEDKVPSWNNITDRYEELHGDMHSTEEEKCFKEIKDNNKDSDFNNWKEKQISETEKNNYSENSYESKMSQTDKNCDLKTGGITTDKKNNQEEIGKNVNTFIQKNEADSSKTNTIANISNSTLIPSDYVKVVGAKFPTRAYYLMAEGLLSKKLLSAIALGEWIDYEHPLIDSFEYRDLLVDLRTYRCKILGMITVKLNPYFYHRRIKFWDGDCRLNNIFHKSNKCVFLDIEIKDGLLWDINKYNVAEEMEKYNCDTIDMQFVLKWHIRKEKENASLVCDYDELDEINYSQHMEDCSTKSMKRNTDDEMDESSEGENEGAVNSSNADSPSEKIQKYNDYYRNILTIENQNLNSFICLAYFMFFEKLEIISKSAGVTLFGLLLSETKCKNMNNTILIIFELLKLGFLETETLLPPDGKLFPKNAYSSVLGNKNLSNQDKKSVFILSRIFSLYDIKLNNNNNYDGLIDFDLCAFFFIIKVIRKTLRQLLQACVSNLLLTNMELIDILPPCLFQLNDEYISGFFTSNYFMGVLVKYLLLFNFGDSKNNVKDTTINNDDSAIESKENENNINIENNVSDCGDDVKEENYWDINKNNSTSSSSDEKSDIDDVSNVEKDKTRSTENDMNFEDDDKESNFNEEKEETDAEKKNENYYYESDINNMEDSQNEISGNFDEFEKAIKSKFPSVIDPIRSLCESINMWRDHLSLIIRLEDYTKVYNIVFDFKEADKFLEKKIRYVGLHKTEEYVNICDSF